MNSERKTQSLFRLRPKLMRRVLAAAGGSAMLAVSIAGCAVQSQADAKSDSPAAEWSYHGANGPDHWGEFGAACQNVETSHESPINVVTSDVVVGAAAAAGASALEMHYIAAGFELENNGHTIEAVPDDLRANSVERDGVTYYLQQFHFHATSEHQIDGESTDAELHLVHQSDDGDLLVLGVMLKVGDENTSLDELFEMISPKVSGDEGDELERQIDPSDLLPADRASVQYEGSLTTPPCSEGVEWNLFTAPATISAEQLALYTAVYPDNHRPVQPLHDRSVFEVTE